MSKRTPDERRCARCCINTLWCICNLTERVENPQSEVSIIMHHRETKLTSNTARMLDNCLTNSQIYLRGIKDVNLSDTFQFKKDHTPLYLFPDDSSEVLNKDFVAKLSTQKIQLIIPDGTWSQAQKFKKREPFLKDIQSVKLEGIPKSIYGLRKQHIEGAVCTMEAAAYALGIIERKEVEAKLIEIFSKISRQLQASRSPNSYANLFLQGKLND